MADNENRAIGQPRWDWIEVGYEWVDTPEGRMLRRFERRTNGGALVSDAQDRPTNTHHGLN